MRKTNLNFGVRLALVDLLGEPVRLIYMLNQTKLM